MEAGPVTAVAVAVRVSRLAPVVGLVPKLAVTPVGRPVADKVTLPVKPPAGTTETVLVVVLPWASDKVAGDAVSV